MRKITQHLAASMVLTTLLNPLPILAKDEFTFDQRIQINKEKVHYEEPLRVMIYSNPFSIYPQFNQPAAYIQTPVIAGVDPLSAMIGAFISVAAINQINQSEKDAAVLFNQNLTNTMSTLDVNNVFQSQLVSQLNASFKQVNFEEVLKSNSLAQAGLLVRIEEPTILTLSNHIYFDAQLRSVLVETNAKVWKKNESRPIYFTELSYASENLTESSKDVLKRMWVENDGILLKEKIKEGINAISKMLINDLSSIKNESELSSSFIEFNNPNNAKTINTIIYVDKTEQENLNRTIGRLGSPDSSRLMSIPKSHFKIKTQP